MKQERLSYLSLAAACVLWGAAIVLGKLSFGELHVAHVVLWRFLFSSVFMLLIVLRSPVRVQLRHVPLFLLAAFIAVPVTYLLQLGGLTLTTATATSLIIGLAPPIFAAASVFIEKVPLSRLSWLAVGISAGGALLVAGSPTQGSGLLGNLLVTASLFTMTASVLLLKRLMLHYPPLFTTAYMFLFGTLMLLPVVWLWQGMPPLHLPGSTWLSLLVQGLACTGLAYSLWNYGVSRVPAAMAGVYSNIEPVSGAALGILVLGEAPTPLTLLGGALILGAAAMVSWPQKEAPSSTLGSPNL